MFIKQYSLYYTSNNLIRLEKFYISLNQNQKIALSPIYTLDNYSNSNKFKEYFDIEYGKLFFKKYNEALKELYNFHNYYELDNNYSLKHKITEWKYDDKYILTKQGRYWQAYYCESYLNQTSLYNIQNINKLQTKIKPAKTRIEAIYNLNLKLKETGIKL